MLNPFILEAAISRNKSKRPVTTLFLLSSLDGKISTGSIDERDVDRDFPNIPGLKEGLSQYYDIELTTELWSLNSGSVMAKVGANTNKIVQNDKAVVRFAVIDNSHLTEHGVRHICGKSKKTVIITKNKSHPAFKIISEIPNLQVMLFENLDDPNAILERLYLECGCKRITVQTGSQLNAVFLRAHAIDNIDLVIAPVIIGGTNTPSVAGGKSLESMDDLKQLTVLKLTKVEALKNSYVRMQYSVR